MKKYSAHWELHGESMSASADTMEELKTKVFGRASAPVASEVKYYTHKRLEEDR